MKKVTEEHEKYSIDFMKEFDTKTESQVTDFLTKMNNYEIFAKNNLLPTNNYGDSVYGILKTLENYINSVSVDDAEEKLKSTDYTTTTQRNNFTRDIEKHFIRMFFINKFLLPFFNFFYKKRKELDKKKIELRNAWSNNGKIPKLPTYNLRELVVSTEYDSEKKANDPDTYNYYYVRHIKPIAEKLVESELKNGSYYLRSTDSNGWWAWWWDELYALFAYALKNITVKCGSSVNDKDFTSHFRAGYDAEGEEDTDGHLWCYKNYQWTEKNSLPQHPDRCDAGSDKWSKDGTWWVAKRGWKGFKYGASPTGADSCSKSWWSDFYTRNDISWAVYQSNIYFKKQYEIINEEIDRLNT